MAVPVYILDTYAFGLEDRVPHRSKFGASYFSARVERGLLVGSNLASAKMLRAWYQGNCVQEVSKFASLIGGTRTNLGSAIAETIRFVRGVHFIWGTMWENLANGCSKLLKHVMVNAKLSTGFCDRSTILHPPATLSNSSFRRHSFYLITFQPWVTRAAAFWKNVPSTTKQF